MSVSVADIAEVLNAQSADSTLSVLLDEAVTLVSEFLGANGRQICPEVIRDLAVKQLCSELFARRSSPGGISTWGPDGQPVRLARDVMASVRPLLSPYRGFGVVG